MSFLLKSFAVEEGTMTTDVQNTQTKEVHKVSSNAWLVTAIFHDAEKGQFYVEEDFIWEN